MAIEARREQKVEYPAQYETEVILKDGSTIFLRPIRKEDIEEWLEFVSRLSTRSKYMRFDRQVPVLGREDAERYTSVDYKNTFALVAEVIRGGRKSIVAIARYYRLPDGHTAQIAFVTEDEYQGKGIATQLLEALANAARDNGISTFEGDVLAENEQMLDVFRDYGFHITSEKKEGEYHISFPIARTTRVAAREEERERIATIASLKYVLCPRAVAIIGASRTPKTIGQLLVQDMIESRYTGTVYPVNPNAKSVMAVKAYRSVLEVPDDVDMAVIAVPAALVARVADECGRKGVHALVVISDGFKERGPEGEAREKELREVAMGHGMRIVGPNCMGVINTSEDIQLNATFSPTFPPRGNVAFLSQSGAMGLTILDYAASLNMGISTFISVGNRADISSNDLLQYWEEDEATRVILLYLESFGNPHKFSRIARRVAAKKPIVAVKSGNTPAGHRAASTHTGALAGSDIASDVLFRNAGIIRVNQMEELFDVATLLSNQPLPAGRRLVIVTNGGGPGIIAADAASNNGLTLPELPPELISKLKGIIKRDITYNNPIDTTAGATVDEFHAVLEALAMDKGNDAVLAIFVPPVWVDDTPMEDAICRVVPLYWEQQKPILACFLGERGFKARLGFNGHYAPSYPFPEEAVSALAKAVEYAELKDKPRGSVPTFTDIDRERAHQAIESALTRSAERPLWLSADEIGELLESYKIRLAPTVVARTPQEAAREASEMGFPVAVKLSSATITHKTEVGGVVLDLNSEKGVEDAFELIHSRLAKIGRADEMEGVTVQKMVTDGVETIVGVTQDPAFGPLIMFGTGGIYAELLKDVVIRLQPLTDLDAVEMVHSIKMARLFEGFRGAPPSDTKSVEELLLRLSAMVEDIPQISELDFNPVKVMPHGEGYWIVDARIMVK